MRDIEREPFETSGCAGGVFEAQSAPQENVLSPPRHRALYPGSHMGKSRSKFKQSGGATRSSFGSIAGALLALSSLFPFVLIEQ
jgi:hypothetical protein